MRIGFDIGGVLSKYPEEFRNLLAWLNPVKCLQKYWYGRENCDSFYIITDQHSKEDVVKILMDNKFLFDNWKFDFFKRENIYCADYDKYGNAAKAILIRDLKLDIFIDDFDGYLQWDSSFGPQPLLLKVMPDMFKPYWHESWEQDGGEFGRRKYNERTA